MCQAHVLIVQGDREEIIRDVILVEHTAAGVRLHTFFEEVRRG